MSAYEGFKPFERKGFPWEVRVSVEYEAEVDLPALIRAHPAEYREEMRNGNEEWERPVVFLCEYLRESAGMDGGISDGHYVRETHWSGDMDFDDITWTPEDFERLIAECPEADLSSSEAEAADDSHIGPNDVPLPIEVSP